MPGRWRPPIATLSGLEVPAGRQQLGQLQVVFGTPWHVQLKMVSHFTEKHCLTPPPTVLQLVPCSSVQGTAGNATAFP